MTKSVLSRLNTNHLARAFAPCVVREFFAAKPLGAVAVYFPRFAVLAAAAAVTGAFALVVGHGARLQPDHGWCLTQAQYYSKAATIRSDPCYPPAMTKLLQKTIAEIEQLPDSEQDAAAGALMDYLDHMRGLQLTEEQAAEVRERLSAPGATISLSEARQRLQRAGQ